MQRIVAAVMLASTGCSLMFVPAVTSTPTASQAEIAHDLVACNGSRASPASDVVFGTLWSLVGLALLTSAQPHQKCDLLGRNCHTTAYDGDFTAAGVVFTSAAITHVVSAAIGFSRASDCRELRERVTSPFETPPPPTPHYGGEREVCWGDGTCNPGLACASGRCVVLLVPVGDS